MQRLPQKREPNPFTDTSTLPERPPTGPRSGAGRRAHVHGIDSEEEYLRQIDKDYLMWGDTVHYQHHPIIAESCNKDIIHAMNGGVYIDTQMWHSSCNFGYNNEAIQGPVVAKLGVLPQVNGDILHKEKLLLAKEIVDAVYERTGVRGRVCFNVSGTLAVEDAIKIVRKNTKKNILGANTGCYHGRSLATSGISSSYRYRKYYGNFSDRAILFPYANCVSCFYGKERETCGMYCAKMIRESFDTDFYGITCEDENEIGGFIIEFCQGRGYTVPPKDYFRNFVPFLQERKILIIADEVQTAMYRTGKLFAFEHYDITPDIITMSKSLTNGLAPLSAVWAREDLVDPGFFGPGHAHSNFANHVLGTTAGLHTWNYMMAQNYEVSVSQKGNYYLDRLKTLRDKYAFIYDVAGLGLLMNIYFADKNGKPYKDMGKKACTIAQDHDFNLDGEKYRAMLNSGGYWNNALKLAPYLDISYDEIDRTVKILDKILNRLSAEL